MAAVMKLLGERWRALEPSDKVPYEDAAAAEKEAYGPVLEAWMARNPGVSPTSKQQVKRAGVPADVRSADVTLELAVELLRYPVVLGNHRGEPVLLCRGPYGPYVKHETMGNARIKVDEDEDVEEEMSRVTLEDAVELLNARQGRGRRGRRGKAGPAKKSSGVASSPAEAKAAAQAVKSRAKSAYQLFSEEARARIRAEEPTLAMSEVMKRIGAEWRALGAKEKAPFQEASAAAKGEAKDTDPAPKRPKGAYMFFCDVERVNVRAEDPSLKLGAVAKVLGERWNALPEDDRRLFEEQAAAAKEAYVSERAAWEARKAEANKVRVP